VTATVESNIVSRLADAAARHPDRLAIADARGRVTFRALHDRVASAGGGLAADGVRAGDRVLVFVPMSVDLYVTLLGTLHAGAVPVFVDAWADRRRLAAAVRAAAPVAFIGSRRASLLRLFSGEVRRIPRAYRPGSAALTRRAGGAPVAVEPDAPALVTFTTGSTGAPKAAERTHAFLLAQHRALAAHLAQRDDDVDMPTLPVFVLSNLALGVPSVIPDADPRRPADIDPRRVHGQMVREGVTTSSGSPAFYERLAAWCERTGETLPLRALFTGGAPVLPPLARRLQAAMVRGTAHVVYGSTEAEPIAGVTAEEMIVLDGIAEGVCAGRPVPEIRLRLVRPHDAPIALTDAGWTEWDVEQGPGEIVVEGAHVLRGYAGDPDADRRNKIRDGDTVWHRTGDAGRLDPDGRLWLLGRVRERVVRDGAVWWPLPAEVRALRVPGVTHAAYVGAADTKRGMRAVLVVESDPRQANALQPALQRALDPWPMDELQVVKRIPRDPRHASKTDLETLRRDLELR
jgi:acyl-CoA synthetase (AMP-forming)/AMP-acid ligase II